MSIRNLTAHTALLALVVGTGAGCAKKPVRPSVHTPEIALPTAAHARVVHIRDFLVPDSVPDDPGSLQRCGSKRPGRSPFTWTMNVVVARPGEPLLLGDEVVGRLTPEGELVAEAKTGDLVETLREALFARGEALDLAIQSGCIQTPSALEVPKSMLVFLDERVSTDVLLSLMYTAGQAGFPVVYVAVGDPDPEREPWPHTVGPNDGELHLSVMLDGDGMVLGGNDEGLYVEDVHPLWLQCADESCDERRSFAWDDLSQLLGDVHARHPSEELAILVPDRSAPWGVAAWLVDRTSAWFPTIYMAGGIDNENPSPVRISLSPARLTPARTWDLEAEVPVLRLPLIQLPDEAEHAP